MGSFIRKGHKTITAAWEERFQSLCKPGLSDVEARDSKIALALTVDLVCARPGRNLESDNPYFGNVGPRALTSAREMTRPAVGWSVCIYIGAFAYPSSAFHQCCRNLCSLDLSLLSDRCVALMTAKQNATQYNALQCNMFSNSDFIASEIYLVQVARLGQIALRADFLKEELA